jgi:hypothetical protein
MTMLTIESWKKKWGRTRVLTSSAAALAMGASALGCGGASAMAKAPAAPVVASQAPAAVVVGGGDFGDGYELGLRNGGILVDRLKSRTTDLQGCSAIGQLESALVKVTRTVRPPANRRDRFVSGFYSGYLDSVRDAIAEVRWGCDLGGYSSGEFAGQLYGAVACQVETISVDALLGLELKPLYVGWSGGSSSVQASCRTTLIETLTACSSGASVEVQLEAAIRVSCSDSASSEEVL